VYFKHKEVAVLRFSKLVFTGL